MAKNPFLLTNAEKEYAMDLFAKGKPLRFVILKIAKGRGLKPTTEVKQGFNQALRSYNPDNDKCSDKNRREIAARKDRYKRDRKRAAFNTKTLLSDSLEDELENTALDVVKDALENIEDPRQLKALIESINLLADTTPETDHAETSETPDNDDQEDVATDAEGTIPAPHRSAEDETEGI